VHPPDLLEIVRPDLADVRLDAHGRIIQRPPAVVDRWRAGSDDRRQAGRITRGISAADRRSGHRQFDYGVSAGNG
jgi:hypothetical protein